MKLPIAVITSLALCACSAPVTRKSPGKEIEAVRDFVVASELLEVDKIHRHDQIKYLYVNDFFVVVPARNSHFLIEFRGLCSELRSPTWTSGMVDIRVNARLLYAGFDTIRGCVIGKIYPLSEPQLEELRYLGDAPGEEQFIPQED